MCSRTKEDEMMLHVIAYVEEQVADKGTILQQIPKVNYLCFLFF